MDTSLLSLKAIKPVLAGLALFSALQGVIIIIQAYFLADSISSLFGGDLFHTVAKKLGYFLCSLVVRQLITVFKNQIVYRFAVQTSRDLRESVLKKIFGLGPRFVKEEGSGQTVTLIMEGTIKYRRYLELFLPKLINSILIPVLICLFIFFEDVRSAVILIISLPILIVFMILLGLTAKEKANRQYESFEILSNHFVDSLRGLETLKYLGLSQKHIKRIILVSEQYRKAVMSTLRIAFLSTFALDFFTMLSIATVAVFLGMDLVHGTMNLQTSLTALILAPEYFLPIREVGADYHATLEGKEAGKKLQDILRKDDANPCFQVVPYWQNTSVFSVKGLNVDNGVLKNINFTVSGTKKVGIIGATGAGKSSLIDALSGFLTPSQGEFLIDGHRVDALSQADWQSQLTYIPQHPYLFSDTVLNNIRFYCPNATEEEAAVAASSAGLTNLIQSLPEGFYTKVGEGGRSLSGGQEQRIALARAFLGNRPILLLDEPTAHLDIETEYELKETIRNIFKDKLVFFATHRLHWMLEMDLILVLDHGKLVESGTHDELMEKKGFYFHLVMEGI